MDVELGHHQLKAIKEMDNGRILRGGVGSGKSRVAIAFYHTKECGGKLKINKKGRFERPASYKDLYIITTAKKRDSLEWNKELSDIALVPQDEATATHPRVTIDSWNNIKDYEGVRGAFFIFDEQRLVGSGAWVKAFYKIARANRWIILSATPGDDWMDYIPVFVANGFYKNRTEFIRRHVVFNSYAKYPKVDRFVDTSVLMEYRNRVLVDMPYRRHTKRRIANRIVDFDRSQLELLTKKRWNPYTDEPIKDVTELFRVARQIVNSDGSRLEELRELWFQHPKLVIFYNFNYELAALRKFVEWEALHDSSSVHAEWNGHKHEEIPNTDRWLYLVQYTAGAEGWNCIDTDAMVFYSMTYSYKQFEQAQGRIDRMNTPFTDLHYYVFRSNSWIDGAIAKALQKKRNFNESAYNKEHSIF